jgi:hypothetical protein
MHFIPYHTKYYWSNHKKELKIWDKYLNFSVSHVCAHNVEWNYFYCIWWHKIWIHKKRLKAIGMMLKLCEWIFHTGIYATDVNFMQKVLNSAPVRCEVHSIWRDRPLYHVLWCPTSTSWRNHMGRLKPKKQLWPTFISTLVYALNRHYKFKRIVLGDLTACISGKPPPPPAESCYSKNYVLCCVT